MKEKRIWVLLFLILVAFLYPVSTLAEKEGTNILFIFDASGSMRGAIEGKSKLKTAKEVLSALVGDLPADANVGLEAYGHRISRTEKNESCKDIETLVPVKRENLKIIIKKLNSLNAKGMTPISASLEKGADVLRGLSGKKTIILISKPKWRNTREKQNPICTDECLSHCIPNTWDSVCLWRPSGKSNI